MKIISVLVLSLFMSTVLSFGQRGTKLVHKVDTTWGDVDLLYRVSDSNLYYANDTILAQVVVGKFYDTHWRLLVYKEIECYTQQTEKISYIIYYENGRIREKYSTWGQYGNKTGFYLSCHENGNVSIIGYYRSEIKDSILIEEEVQPTYWEDHENYNNGAIIRTRRFKEEKVGVWKQFDQDGNLIKEEFYPE